MTVCARRRFWFSTRHSALSEAGCPPALTGRPNPAGRDPDRALRDARRGEARSPRASDRYRKDRRPRPFWRSVVSPALARLRASSPSRRPDLSCAERRTSASLARAIARAPGPDCYLGRTARVWAYHGGRPPWPRSSGSAGDRIVAEAVTREMVAIPGKRREFAGRS
jgi:hypothetical protein